MARILDIQSTQNEKIKGLVALAHRKERDAQKQFTVEGVREIGQALRSGFTLKAFCFHESVDLKEHAPVAAAAQSQLAEIWRLSDKVFAKLAMRDTTENLFAVFAQKPQPLPTKIDGSEIFLVVEGVEKPGNLGALFRTADGAGITGIFVTDGTDVYNPNCIRASLGGVFTVPHWSCANDDVVQFCKNGGIRTVAASPFGKDDLHSHAWQLPVAIVLGSEAHGLSPLWQKSADAQVKIPMHGTIDSLNVSVAGALFVYEAVRHRR